MSKLKNFHQTLALFKIIVFLQYNIEAIHNKDYSVVKTSKAEQCNLLRLFLFRLLIKQPNNICYQVDKSRNTNNNQHNLSFFLQRKQQPVSKHETPPLFFSFVSNIHKKSCPVSRFDTACILFCH